MLRFMHRYQAQMGWVVMIGAVALAMSGFGFRLFDQREERVALTVNGKKIGFDEFDRTRRSIDARYRQILGPNYGKMAKSMLGAINDQAKDQLIHATLVDGVSDHLGLGVGHMAPVEYINRDIFAGNRAAYENYLAHENLTPDELIDEVGRELRRTDVTRLFGDIMQASPEEVRAKLRDELSSYNVGYVTLDPQEAEKSLPQPDEATLQAFFEKHKKDYALPLRASYEYAVAAPDKFLEKVEVAEDEMNFYYTEHEHDFISPEQAHIRQIELSFPENAKAEQITAVKTKADEIYAKLQGGAAFDAMALEHSADLLSKTSGGDIGWVTRPGKLAAELSEKVFGQKKPGLLPPIETPNGYYILKIEEYKEPRQKQYSEAKSEIQKILQRRDAPDYALQAAEKIFELVQKGAELAKAVEGSGLEYGKTEGMLARGQDPKPELAALSEKVLEFPDDTKSDLIQLENATVVALLKERKEPEIPELAAVREKVMHDYKVEKAKTSSRERAQALLEKAKSSSLEKEAQAQQLKFEKAADVARSKPASDLTGAPAFRDAVFATPTGKIGKQPVEAQGKLVVFQVLDQKKPSEDEVAKKVEETQRAETQKLGTTLYRAVLNEADAKATIDFDANLMGG